MNKTLQDSLSEHLLLEEGKLLRKCAGFFGFLAVYILFFFIGSSVFYVYQHGLITSSFLYAGKAVLTVPTAAVLFWFYHNFKKRNAYFCCIILKIAGFTVIFCNVLLLFTTYYGLNSGLSTERFLIIGSSICMFIYSIILDSNFLRRGAFIYSLVSILGVYILSFVVLNWSHGNVLLTSLASWVIIGSMVLAPAFGYLLIMIGILRKNKELARMKIYSTPSEGVDTQLSD